MDGARAVRGDDLPETYGESTVGRRGAYGAFRRHPPVRASSPTAAAAGRGGQCRQPDPGAVTKDAAEHASREIRVTVRGARIAVVRSRNASTATLSTVSTAR